MISRIAVLALAVAACKTSPPTKETGSSPPHDSGRVAPAPVDAAIVAAIDAPPLPPPPPPDAGKKGTAMTPEAILQDHYAQDSRGAPVNLQPFPNVPGFYQAQWAKDAEYVLVHEGALVTAKGLDALAAYMKSVDLIAAPQLEPIDLIKLVRFFDAFMSKGDGDGYYTAARFKDLQPKLERDQGAGVLVMSYLPPAPSQGSRANANLRKVARTTLTIPKDYKLSWAVETIDFDISQP